MDSAYYLDRFQKGVDLLDKQPFQQKQLDLNVGIWLDSVCLKIQKPWWFNPSSPGQQHIFFSIWISDKGIAQNRIYYNIHALKLRELNAYRIESREFANAFRSAFESHEDQWPNVSTQFGPLTLMEGWMDIYGNDIENIIAQLATKFSGIESIIDTLLEERKR